MNTYWYLFQPMDIKDLLKQGLLPANAIPGASSRYETRGKGSAQTYYRVTYEQLYQAVAGPYHHYGIYTTPIDLPTDDYHGPKLRIRFSLTDLRNVVVDIRYASLGKPLTQDNTRTLPPFALKSITEARLQELLAGYTPAYIHEIWHRVQSRKFRFLPQVIHFGPVPLRFKMDQVEFLK